MAVIVPFSTIPEMFINVTDRFAMSGRPYLMHKIQGKYEGLRFSEVRERVELFALGLAALGIKKGDRVWVESPRGKVPFTARVTDAVVPGVVEVNVGGGNPIQAEAWREANANYLTDLDNRDPISGFPVFKALLCDVRKMGST